LKEPYIKPGESNATSRAMIGMLGLPVGSARGLGINLDSAETDEDSGLNLHSDGPTIGNSLSRPSDPGFGYSGLKMETKLSQRCFICFQAMHRSEVFPQRSLGMLFCKRLDDPHRA
jgi:hypothetical protein